MPTLIKNGKNYSGTSVSLTQAEYDALTETQKNDGTVYFITDSNAVLDASDVSVGSGTVEDSIGSIAVIETSPATSSHAVGTYLVYNGKLYKITSAISANEQLVVGTNIVATTVGNELDLQTPTVTNSGRFSTTNIIAYKIGKVLIIGGYFSNTSAANGNVATINNCYPISGSENLSVACQCDDSSVDFVTFENSGNNLIVKIAKTLTANKYIRFQCALPCTQ